MAFPVGRIRLPDNFPAVLLVIDAQDLSSQLSDLHTEPLIFQSHKITPPLVLFIMKQGTFVPCSFPCISL